MFYPHNFTNFNKIMGKRVVEEKTEQNEFINPIDPKKVAQNPGLLPYAHTAGGAIIKPMDKGRTRGIAMKAMYQQTDRQMNQLRKQMETLMAQAKALEERVVLSEKIYQAETGFKPVVGYDYFLYQKQDGKYLISMVSPEEWGAKAPYNYVAEVRLLADHTWEIIDSQMEIHFYNDEI
jgi:Protein of unknown function (DUF2452)